MCYSTQSIFKHLALKIDEDITITEVHRKYPPPTISNLQTLKKLTYIEEKAEKQDTSKYFVLAEKGQ